MSKQRFKILQQQTQSNSKNKKYYVKNGSPGGTKFNLFLITYGFRFNLSNYLIVMRNNAVA